MSRAPSLWASAGSAAQTVGAWGEERLIREIRRWLGAACPPSPAGIGDDCAVLPAAGVRLVTVDPIIYGRHFDGSLRPALAGAKLLKRNLSDIAAMGGRPTAAVIGLILTPNVRVKWLEEFYRGLAAAARRYRVAIVGGDVAEAPEAEGRPGSGRRRSAQGDHALPLGAGFFSAHLTLLGTLPAGGAVTRRGARIGDRIYVTGLLGGSLASGHHFRFAPRLKEGEWLAAHQEVRAMIDVSDGLGKDVRALVPEGGAPAIWGDLLPRRPGASVEQALSDGEDYELLFVLGRAARAGAFESAFRRRFPATRLTAIGRFCPAGRLPPGILSPQLLRGYEHLR